MMKLKVLPGLVRGHARLALVLCMFFFLPPICGSLGRNVGGSGRGWCGSLLGHCHPGEAAPSSSRRRLEGDMATSASSAGAPCLRNPLRGLAQYRGSPVPVSCTDLLVLYLRSRRRDGRCAARCRSPQCEYGAHGPEEMLGELGCPKPLPVLQQLQLCLRGWWGHQPSASLCAGG